MRCGLLGKTLGHSASPQLHALLGTYEYRLYECAEQEIPAFLRTCGLRGLNVTVPYKRTVLSCCDTISQTAQEIGSANTLLFENGHIHGDNTDAYGFACLLDRYGVPVSEKKVLVLGSGGAAKAVQFVLRQRKAKVTVISRSGENNYENLNRHANADIIVNATPVGMYPANGMTPLALSQFPRCKTVIDLIYNPLKTELLLQAEAQGKQAINGLYMLAAQAKRAAELFQGCKLPEELTENAAMVLKKQLQNIILIGMPSCGKTTVGSLLARQLDRPFLDSDEAFTATYEISPEAFLRQYGEAAFRKMETEILKNLSKKTGCVIATGGGAVTVPQNQAILRQNGVIVYLKRPLSDLSAEGRPLAQKNGMEMLAEHRLPLYQSWADLAVNEEMPNAAADTIRKELWR